MGSEEELAAVLRRLDDAALAQVAWLKRIFWLMVIGLAIPALAAVALIFGPQALLSGPVFILGRVVTIAATDECPV
jgi:hypothetical protein